MRIADQRKPLGSQFALRKSPNSKLPTPNPQSLLKDSEVAQEPPKEEKYQNCREAATAKFLGAVAGGETAKKFAHWMGGLWIRNGQPCIHDEVDGMLRIELIKSMDSHADVNCPHQKNDPFDLSRPLYPHNLSSLMLLRKMAATDVTTPNGNMHRVVS
ncbi:MAG: hypothetical protein ACR2G6_09380 [Gemmatimonadaceae bacterium]